MSEQIVRVANIMQTELNIVDGLSSVVEAVEEMGRKGVSSLIIERRDEDDEYGVLTIRDIASKVVSKGRSMSRTSVYEVMSKPAMTVAADMNVRYAIRMLSRFNINRALVMQDDKLVGIVTLRDMVLGFAKVDGLPVVKK